MSNNRKMTRRAVFRIRVRSGGEVHVEATTVGKNVTKSERVPDRADMIAAIGRGELSFPPLTLCGESPKTERQSGGEEERTPDAVVGVGWGEREFRFAAVCRAAESPKEVREAADVAVRAARSGEGQPLVVVPFLPSSQLDALLALEVSGLDLCGNGVLVVPGEVLVYRTGSPNRFLRRGTIKNVYRRSSSVVARLFLVVPAFDSVNDAREEINRRGGTAALGTVSKVCEALDADLILERTRDSGAKNRNLRLLQGDKLLDRLAENYTPPATGTVFVGRYAKSAEELVGALAAWQKETDGRVVRTGVGSVDAYAVMAREPIDTFYCTDVPGLVSRLGTDVRAGERFANLRLLQTRDELPYFDARPGLLASPIQTYLELAAGDKRDRETADQVRRLILGALAKVSEKEVAGGPSADQSA